MARERSMSGTIPSMETSHDELKDNTIIVGEHARLSNLYLLTHRQFSGRLAIWPRKRHLLVHLSLVFSH